MKKTKTGLCYNMFWGPKKRGATIRGGATIRENTVFGIEWCLSMKYFSLSYSPYILGRWKTTVWSRTTATESRNGSDALHIWSKWTQQYTTETWTSQPTPVPQRTSQKQA